MTFGKRQIVQWRLARIAAAAARAGATSGAGADSSGHIILPGGSVYGAKSAVGARGMWWNFTSQQHTDPLVDRIAGVILSNNAGSATAVTVRDKAVVTMTIATPCVVSDAGHTFTQFDRVRFVAGPEAAAALPTGLTQGVDYYVLTPVAGSYNLSLTPFGTTAIATSGTQSGTHSRYSDPGRASASTPGVMFTNGGFLQTSLTQQYALQQDVMRLDTLDPNGSDAIYIAMDVVHGKGSSGADANLLYWGRRASTSSGQGWGICILSAASQVKLGFNHTGPGGTTSDQFPLEGALRLQGDTFSTSGTGANVRSVLAIMISRMPVALDTNNTNFGRGGGLFYMEIHKLGITDQGYFGQRNCATVQPYCIPPNSATGIASVCDTPLTIGAQPLGVPGTVGSPMQSTHGLHQIIIQRRPRKLGLVSTIARQMAVNALKSPIPVQPDCIAI